MTIPPNLSLTPSTQTQKEHSNLKSKPLQKHIEIYIQLSYTYLQDCTSAEAPTHRLNKSAPTFSRPAMLHKTNLNGCNSNAYSIANFLSMVAYTWFNFNSNIIGTLSPSFSWKWTAPRLLRCVRPYDREVLQVRQDEFSPDISPCPISQVMLLALVVGGSIRQWAGTAEKDENKHL